MLAERCIHNIDVLCFVVLCLPAPIFIISIHLCAPKQTRAKKITISCVVLIYSKKRFVGVACMRQPIRSLNNHPFIYLSSERQTIYNNKSHSLFFRTFFNDRNVTYRITCVAKLVSKYWPNQLLHHPASHTSAKILRSICNVLDISIRLLG